MRRAFAHGGAWYDVSPIPPRGMGRVGWWRQWAVRGIRLAGICLLVALAVVSVATGGFGATGSGVPFSATGGAGGIGTPGPDPTIALPRPSRLGAPSLLYIRSAAEGVGNWWKTMVIFVELASALGRDMVEPCVSQGRIVPCTLGTLVPLQDAIRLLYNSSTTGGSGAGPSSVSAPPGPSPPAGRTSHTYPMSFYMDFAELCSRFGVKPVGYKDALRLLALANTGEALGQVEERLASGGDPAYRGDRAREDVGVSVVHLEKVNNAFEILSQDDQEVLVFHGVWNRNVDWGYNTIVQRSTPGAPMFFHSLEWSRGYGCPSPAILRRCRSRLRTVSERWQTT